MIDSTAIGLLFFALVSLVVESGISDTRLRVLIILLPVILIEPLMLWITGGTLGQHISGIRVVGKNSGKNLFLLNGVVRFIAKWLFGLFSVASMFLTKRHQSIHDFLSSSVVVFKDEAAAPERLKLMSRDNVYVDRKPSIARRLVVILAYLAIIYIVSGLSAIFSVPLDCLESRVCNATENLVLGFIGLGALAVAIAVVVLGFLSKLPGAHYRRAKATNE